jgi:hypothetical protein
MPFIQNMGSKQKDTPGNFSENDAKTISNSPLAKTKVHLQKEGDKTPLKDLANHPEVIAHNKHAEKTNN